MEKSNNENSKEDSVSLIRNAVEKNELKKISRKVLIILAILLIVEGILVTYWGKKAWMGNGEDINKLKAEMEGTETYARKNSEPAQIFIDNYSIEGEIITLTIQGVAKKWVDETDYTWFLSEFFTKKRAEVIMDYTLSIGIKYESLTFDKENGVKITYKDEDFHCISIDVSFIELSEEVSKFEYFSMNERTDMIDAIKQEIKAKAFEEAKEDNYAGNCLRLSKKGLEVLLCNFAYGVGLDKIYINGIEFNTENYKNLDDFSIKVKDGFEDIELQ